MLTRRLSKVCATLSLFLLCSAGLASAAEASSAGSARHASPRIIDVARDASFGSSGTAVASAAPLSASETFRALLQPLSTGKIIHVTNNSFFDGSTGGGGVIFLAGNVIKTARRAAHLAIAVTAVRKSGGKVGPLAEKSDDCPKATSCQVTSVERGHGNNYRVPGISPERSMQSPRALGIGGARRRSSTRRQRRTTSKTACCNRDAHPGLRSPSRRVTAARVAGFLLPAAGRDVRCAVE